MNTDFDEGGVARLADGGEVAQLGNCFGKWSLGSDAGVFSESGDTAKIRKHLGEDAIGTDAFKFSLYKIWIGKGLGFDG